MFERKNKGFINQRMCEETMTKQEFRELAQQGLLFLDGATGSNLMRRGMPGGVCPEKWIAEHPDVLTGLQKEYLEAGSHILYAPTFTANRIKLAEYGLEKEIRSLNLELVAASRRAAGDRALVCCLLYTSPSPRD